MPNSIADRIHTFLTKAGQPVSLTYLKDRTKDICTYGELLDALGHIGRLPDIKVTVKDNTNHYSIRTLATPKAIAPMWRPSLEERARMDEESRNYWEHSPFVTTEERECYYQSFIDRNRWKTCECSSCTQWRYMLSTREERAMAEVVRQREVMRNI